MIEGREERDPGYDDWFDEPEPLTETKGNAARGVYDDVEEVWVMSEEDRPRARVRREIVIGGRTVTTAQAAIIVASAIAVLIAVLAAAGVFSPSKAATPPVTNPTPPPTVTPPASTPSTPAQTAQAPDQTLSPGATGTQVKILQRALNALGYPVGKPDGDYGPVTQTAVEKFQLAKNLPEDGVVGPQTLAALQQALSG